MTIRVSRILDYLGHGRALETYLACTKILFGIFVIPGNKVVIFSDLQWYVSDLTIAMPFVIVGTIQIIGLVLNCQGYPRSWIFRVVGSSLAMSIWLWIIIKSLFIDAVLVGIFPFCVTSFLASGYLFWRAWNRLPVPGALGIL